MTPRLHDTEAGQRVSADDAAHAGKIFGSVTGHFRTLAVHAAVTLGIPDALGNGAVDLDALAQMIAADRDALARLLRALCTLDVVSEVELGRFALTPCGSLLRTDHPASVVPLVRLATADFHWESWRRISEAVRTGRSGFELRHGEPLFKWLAHESQAAALFDNWMTRITEIQAPALLAAYDYAWASTIVDVGGGQGAWLLALLSEYPGIRAVLFDMPGVVAAAGVTGKSRLEAVGGDFFKAVPAGGDLYLLKTILHDWDDDACVNILQNCAAVLPAHGRILIAEMLLPVNGTPSPAWFMDLNMLVLNRGGRERTPQHYAALCSAAGMEVTRTISTSCPLSLLEAVPR